MKSYDCIVIGGGASGTMSAINLAKNGIKTAVVDKNSLIAKKLLVTGNGRCNISNNNLSNENYNQNIEEYFSRFNFIDTKSYFSDIGIEIYCDDEGRAYPISNSAKSVVNTFENQLQKLNISLYKEQNFLSMDKVGDVFVVKTDNFELQSKSVILACGGNAITSSLEKFHISYKKFVPSLVALKTKQSTKILDGVRISGVKVKLISGKNSYIQNGEVLFKEQGLSGICIFNISCYLARKNNFNAKLTIDLLPNFSQKYLEQKLSKLKTFFDDMVKMISCFVNEKMAKEIVFRCNLNNLKPNSLSDSQIENIALKLKNLEYDVIGHYDNNQVYSGGVELQNLTTNLECKNLSNLFIVGELVDIDGECGGYNLQWAWTSGFLASQEIINRSK